MNEVNLGEFRPNLKERQRACSSISYTQTK